MKALTILSVVLIFLLSFRAEAQNHADTSKIPLSPAVYPHWKSLNNIQSSIDGSRVCYEVKPARGDGFLVVHELESGRNDTIARAVQARFSPDGSYVAFLIKPQYQVVRALKLKKTKRSKLPKDSLGILLFSADSLIKIPKVKRFALADSLSPFLVYESMSKKIQAKTQKHWWDFMKKKAAEKSPAQTPKGLNLYVYNPLSAFKRNYEGIDKYTLSHDGRKIALVRLNESDSSTTSEVTFFDTHTQSDSLFFKQEGVVKGFTFDRKARQAAFYFSADTAKKDKVYTLYFAGKNQAPKLLADSNSSALDSAFCPSPNGRISFSKDGSKLYFGVASIPHPVAKDTLLDDEKYSVDVWNYRDGLLQPEQKLKASRERKRTYLTVYHIALKLMHQLETPQMPDVRLYHQGNANFALALNNKPYERERSWDGFYSDVYVINTIDNRKELVLKHFQGKVSLSDGVGYLLYFNKNDSSWYAYDIKGRRHQALTKGMKVNFYNEDNDVPALPDAYGSAGWYSGDKYVVLYDRYDLWRIDPSGRRAPLNLTAAYGRQNKIRLRRVKLDKYARFFNDEKSTLLYAFNEKNKQSGFYRLNENSANPEKLIMTNHRYYYPNKPEGANYLYWRRMSFQEYPDLYTSDMDFGNNRRISKANPQQDKYLWGSVSLTHWTSFQGLEYDGLVYKPENFDSTKKYPVIVYFYERYSDDMHQYYTPKPSHSIIGFSEYVSNGYIVFVPDIRYRIGHPGPSAYDAVVSGTRHLMKYPWVDSTKIGLQGQSWGGYEVAYLVTQTDMYACAESGAPVSNMFSAYGGIRWGSGMSRAFQYEKTQSRIGATPWDSTQLYIENSPIFFAPKVNTPLLIMHNDKDGAVPWYQGIEYFNALRRLNKKVWMLSYNNDGHNLMKWPNRVDLSIRMMQFFNHYLKGEPMPEWMENGIPATEKGHNNGYRLTK